MRKPQSVGNRNTGIILSYAYTLLNMLCGLFLSSFLLRTLGDTEYGIYQTISSFASYLVLLEFGTGTIMTRNIASCRGKCLGREEIDKNVSTVWTVTHILSLVIILFSAVFYVLIGTIYSESLTAEQIIYAKEIFVLVAANLVVSFYLQSLNGITLGFEKYPYMSLQNIARVLLRTGILTVIIIFFRYSVFIALTDLLISILIMIAAVIYCKKKLRVNFGFFRFDKLIFKSALPLCAAIFLQAIINQANSNVDKFIIGIKMTPEDVTFYSVALYIFTVFSSLMTIPISMYAPQVSMDMSRNITRKELSEKLITPSRLAATVGGLVLFGFIAAGRQFISLLYGGEYVGAWAIALIIMIPTYVYMINEVLENVLNYLNKRIVRSLILTGTTVANIVMTVFFINIWGMTGAAAATCICTVIGQVFIMSVYYSKRLKIRILYMYKNALRGILPCLVIASAAGFAAGYYINNTLLSFLVSGGVFLIVFGIGYLLFGADEKEKSRILKIIRGKQIGR